MNQRGDKPNIDFWLLLKTPFGLVEARSIRTKGEINLI